MRIATLTAFVLVLVLCAPASAARKGIWGPVDLPDGSSAFPVYEDLGVEDLQLGLAWSAVARTRPAAPRNPADPAYTWPAEIDEAIRRGRRVGIRISLLVNSSPLWANGGRGHAWAPRNSWYADFLTAASRRYPGINVWMIWGEANRAAVFQPLPVNSPIGPQRYATLLRAAFRALKREDKKNTVVGGMTFSFGDVRPRDFIRWMRLPNGRPPPLDMYGHNPFTRRLPDIRLTGYSGYPGARDISDSDLFARELRRIYRGRYPWFRRRGPKLWLSEFTLSSDRANRAFDFYGTRKTQASWLRAAYRAVRPVRSVAMLGWFNLLDAPAGEPFGLTTGLMTYEGERKASYHAYRRVR